MIQVTVRFFAGQRTIVGQSELHLTLDDEISVGELWQQLVTDYPDLAKYSAWIRYAVNQEFCDTSTQLKHGDEVACIPPVSGGSSPPPTAIPEPLVITEKPLDPVPMVRLVQTSADGAIVTFTGVVRDHHEGQATAYLTYEAYADMALAYLARIADEARNRWPIGKVAIHHRVGRLEIGETAVIVVVAAAHRQPAFAAAEYIMDRIKEDVPIWKCEHRPNGSSDWQDTSHK